MNPPAAAAPPFGLAARAALLQAACTVWLPVLTPVVTGMLRGSTHAQQMYLLSFPLVPGILVPVLLNLDDAWFFIAGGVVTLALFAVVVLALRELPRKFGFAVQAVVVLAVAAEAIGYTNALRA
ncbi:MAG: hypothetical protein WAT39_11330 [Planctomycetota bacterium]